MNKKLSILFVGAGKRVSLIQRFKLAAAKLGVELSIFSYELNKYQPISLEAKIIEGLKWPDENIEEHILSCLKKYKIDLLISNTDPGTIIHSKLKNKHHSAELVTDYELVKLCSSKIQFQQLCQKHNLEIIPLAKDNEFPCFAKPDTGASSRGIQVINSQDQKIKLRNEKYIFQKYIKGKEYTVDVYISKKSQYTLVSPRLRIETLNGEVVETKTIDHPTINQMCNKILKILKFLGPVTIQFIECNYSNKIYLMEINPRFGGGVIASIEAGFNIPEIMLQELMDNFKYKSKKIKHVTMKRYYKEVFYETSN